MPAHDQEGGPTAERPRRVYANYTGVQGGAFDVVLRFGYQIGDEPAELLADVNMSWEHASAVVRLLLDALEKYQAQVGTLPDVQALKQDSEEVTK